MHRMTAPSKWNVVLNKPMVHMLSMNITTKRRPKAAVLWVNVADSVLANHLYDNEKIIPFTGQRPGMLYSSTSLGLGRQNSSKSSVKACESRRSPVFRSPDPTFAGVLGGKLN